LITLFEEMEMTTFAAVVFDPVTIAGWLVVGLVSGWLANKVMEAPTYGMIGDLILGSLGALAGGLLLGFLREGDPRVWSLLTAFIGACILIGGARAIAAVRGA
jgi:uncharacterized membrane protein YeaQ/YmgE (transglycosylase-associated protein family)